MPLGVGGEGADKEEGERGLGVRIEREERGGGCHLLQEGGREGGREGGSGSEGRGERVVQRVGEGAVTCSRREGGREGFRGEGEGFRVEGKGLSPALGGTRS